MRLAVLLALLAGLRVAHADSIKAPPGWVSDAAAAVSLSQQLSAVPHFGGLQSIATTEVYRTPGGSLFVTRVVANVKEADRHRAATAELGEVDSGMIRAGGNARPEAGASREDEATKQLVATRMWLDASTNVRTAAAIVVAADTQQLVAVLGECVFAADAAGEIVAPCKTALGTLDPGVPADKRVALQLDAATLDQLGKRSAPVPDGTARSGPTLGDSGERPALPPMEIPQAKREPDRRPIYVGFGLIVLAVVFYFNRKNREKLEREYEQRTADEKAKPEKTDEPEPEKAEPEAEKKKAAKPDGDADDLHAAAADDGTKEEKS